MTQHEQSWVKVNAQVDAGIAEIVSLLNTVPRLETVSSCEGGPGEAYIYFRLGDWQSVGTFLFDQIEPAFASLEGYAVSIEVFNNSDPTGKISFRAENVKSVHSALKLALEASARRFPCSCGTECTELHR